MLKIAIFSILFLFSFWLSFAWDPSNPEIQSVDNLKKTIIVIEKEILETKINIENLWEEKISKLKDLEKDLDYHKKILKRKIIEERNLSIFLGIIWFIFIILPSFFILVFIYKIIKVSFFQ